MYFEKYTNKKNKKNMCAFKSVCNGINSLACDVVILITVLLLLKVCINMNEQYGTHCVYVCVCGGGGGGLMPKVEVKALSTATKAPMSHVASKMLPCHMSSFILMSLGSMLRVVILNGHVAVSNLIIKGHKQR